MQTVSTLGEDSVFFHDLRMSCESKTLKYTAMISCPEPTHADFSFNGSGELLICCKESSNTDDAYKQARIYDAKDLKNLNTLTDVEPSNVINNISQVYPLTSIKDIGEFQYNTTMLPNSVFNNQAVWHPNIQDAIVVSRCLNVGRYLNNNVIILFALKLCCKLNDIENL